MPACLCIQLTSTITADVQEIRFFDSEEWDAQSEKDLLARVQEILSLVRNISHSCEVKISFNVTDLNQAAFLVNKKTAGHFQINNQKLSIREIEVLGLIMDGLTNNEIAMKLFISYETVKSHRKNILEKTGAKNTAALINHYHQTFFDK